jgi:glycosyltransferase involved in cell wall biosynthesis
VPLVTTSHGTDLRLLEKSAGAAPLARYVFTRSAAVTCVSAWLAEIARPFARAEPIVAPMPAETELFVPGGERVAGRLLFVGRLTEQKGIASAIEAIARMREPATLDIVGDGPLGDTLARLVSRLGIEGRVHFHPSVRHEDLADMYRGATALVVPSTGEGLGLVAVEALLCETPVVAFASGGIVDVVRHERTGLLVPPGDVDALARALDRIVADDALARRLGSTGRVAALERFTPQAAARTYSAIYRDVLDRHGRHAA